MILDLYHSYSQRQQNISLADADLKTCAISPQDLTQLEYVRIEGKDLDTTKIDRVTTSFYNVTIPSNPAKGIFDFGPPVPLFMPTLL